MSNNQINKKYQRVIQITILLLVGFILAYNVIISHTKVFVLGKVNKIGSGAHSNTSYYFNYRFKGVDYDGSILGASQLTDSFLIIKISSKIPSMYSSSELDVPKCIANERYLDYYWDSAPNCEDMKLSR